MESAESATPGIPSLPPSTLQPASPPQQARRVTISDVANAADVSSGTVSNVLNGRFHLMQPETLLRVQRAIRELDYRPSRLARSLRTQRTNVVGLIVPSASNSVYPALIKGAQDEGLTFGFDIFVCSTDRDPSKNAIHVDSLLDHQVDGIIFIHSLNPHDPLVRRCVRAGRRVVVFAPTTESPIWADTVCLDNRQASLTVMEYLRRLGHQRIAFADHSLTSASSKVRGAYLREALAQAGFPTLQDYYPVQRVAVGLDEGYEVESGKSMIRRLMSLPAPPTAVIGSNDLIAAGLLIGAKELGYRIPSDLSVVGSDDLTVGRVTEPSLTTMSVAWNEMGRSSMRMLRNQLAGSAPIQEVFQFELLVRRSTGPAQRNRSARAVPPAH